MYGKENPMKKLLIFILVLGTLVLSSSCKKENDINADNLPTIKWIISGNVQPDLDTVEAAANEIITKKLGCKLDLRIIDYNAYKGKLKLAMASGEGFDLCLLDEPSFSDAVQRGGLLALDEYISKGNIKQSVPEDILKYGQYNGSVYAVPNIQIMAVASSLYIREDLAKEYNLDTESIHNLNDLEPFLHWVKTNYPQYYPIRMTTSLGRMVKGYEDTFYDELISSAVYAYEEDGRVKVVKAVDYEPFWALAELKNDWYKKGYIRADVAVSSSNDWDDVSRGMYAVYMETYKPGGIEGTNQDLEGVDYIEVLFCKLYNNYNAGAAAMTGISSFSKNPELAYRLIELVNTDKELFNILAFGVEGKHYTKDNDGKIAINVNGGYVANAGWKFGNQFNAYVLSIQPDDVWEQTKKLNEESPMSKLTGFRPDYTNIKLEISQINTVQNKYKSVQMGSDDLSAYREEYIKEINAAGIDTVVEELQRQVDEWIRDNAN